MTNNFIYMVRTEDGTGVFLDRGMYEEWCKRGGPECEEWTGGVWTMKDYDEFEWDNWLPKDD